MSSAPSVTVASDSVRSPLGRGRKAHVGRDAVEARAASSPQRARARGECPAARTARRASPTAMRPSSVGAALRRFAQRLRRGGDVERASATSTARLHSSAADALLSAPEKRRNSAVATSARITNATSTSSSEKPRVARGATRRARRVVACSVENRDTAGQPVDVDFELALAGGDVMRPPLLPPSGKKRIAPTLSSTRSFAR